MALLALVWWAALLSVNVSLWLTAAAILLISLFSVRVFALMHECGHGSLFCTQRLNRTFGFLLGDSILRDEPEDTRNPLDEDPSEQIHRLFGPVAMFLHVHQH